jgi:hypothetical protein
MNEEMMALYRHFLILKPEKRNSKYKVGQQKCGKNMLALYFYVDRKWNDTALFKRSDSSSSHIRTPSKSIYKSFILSSKEIVKGDQIKMNELDLELLK